MKKSQVKTILGASLVAIAITNSQASTKKVKKIRYENLVHKIKDQSNNQESVNDGSKTERASSK